MANNVNQMINRLFLLANVHTSWSPAADLISIVTLCHTVTNFFSSSEMVHVTVLHGSKVQQKSIDLLVTLLVI